MTASIIVTNIAPWNVRYHGRGEPLAQTPLGMRNKKTNGIQKFTKFAISLGRETDEARALT